MSVTFFPELAPVVGYRLADYFGGRDQRLFGSHAEAVAAMVAAREARTVLPGCTDPKEIALYGEAYRVDVVTSDGDDTGPERNMANANARSVLSLLGYEEDGEVLDLAGSCGAEEFLGRVLTARALAPVDAGVPALELVGNGGATVVDCGRSPGYHQEARPGRAGADRPLVPGPAAARLLVLTPARHSPGRGPRRCRPQPSGDTTPRRPDHPGSPGRRLPTPHCLLPPRGRPVVRLERRRQHRGPPRRLRRASRPLNRNPSRAGADDRAGGDAPTVPATPTGTISTAVEVQQGRSVDAVNLLIARLT